MLRLKIILRMRRSVRAKCPRHPRYNPERESAGAIRGGCPIAWRYTNYIQASLRPSDPCKHWNNKSHDVRRSIPKLP